MMSFGADSLGPTNYVLDGVKIPTGRGNFGGCPMGSRSPQEGAILGVVRFIEKHWESVLQFVQQKGSLIFQ